MLIRQIKAMQYSLNVAFSTTELLDMTRSVNSFALSRGVRAEIDFEQQRRHKPNFIHELAQKVVQA